MIGHNIEVKIIGAGDQIKIGINAQRTYHFEETYGRVRKANDAVVDGAGLSLEELSKILKVQG